MLPKLVHGQVTIIVVVSVGLSVCLSVCLFVQFFSAVSDPISIKLGHTAGGQKWVIIMSVAQAVECYVAHFHAINYEYSNRLLPQISQYYVIYFSLITLQRIYPGIDSYSCQIQVECSSRFHSNTHAIRSPRVLRFEISFCTQRLITFQNVFDNVDIQLLCRQEILEILCLVFHW